MSNDQDYESLYSPSHWSRRLSKDVIVKNHIEFITYYSEEILKVVPANQDIKYGNGNKQVYSIIGTDLPSDSPILFVVHGGYWQSPEITHRNMGFLSKPLYNHKIKVVPIDYDQCPDVTIEEINKEVEVALSTVLEYAITNKSRGVHLLGHSVGAHMLASLFNRFINDLPTEKQNMIKNVFLVCGLYDLTLLPLTTINEALRLTEATARELSPQFMILSGPSHIKMHVIVVENDAPPFVEQGKNFHEKLEKINIETAYHFIEDEDHFSVLEKLTDNDFALTRIIMKNVN